MGKGHYTSLIAKGPPKSVKRAAARHGIATSSCRKVGNDTQCYVDCKPGINRRIGDWYSEHASKKPGRGHLPGTLLYFTSCKFDGFSGARKRRRKRK